MIPHTMHKAVGSTPQLVALLAAVVVLLAPTSSPGKGRRGKPQKSQSQSRKSKQEDKQSPTERGKTPPRATVVEKKTKQGKEQVFDFTGLQLGGSVRTPQLLYFLDRANQELERASLERRSFLREMSRSVELEGL